MVSAPQPTQGYTTQQTWAQPQQPAPVDTYTPPADNTAYDTPAPDAPAQEVVVNETVNQTTVVDNNDPNRPLRRKRN